MRLTAQAVPLPLYRNEEPILDAQETCLNMTCKMELVEAVDSFGPNFYAAGDRRG
jgi:hypothetical protein